MQKHNYTAEQESIPNHSTAVAISMNNSSWTTPQAWRGLSDGVVKTLVSNHETSHLQPASVRILLGLCEKVCQFTCGRSVDSPKIHLYDVTGFSLPPLKIDRHHIIEKLLSMAKNDKQTQNKHGRPATCILKCRELPRRIRYEISHLF
jgi:hypothetical protein